MPPATDAQREWVTRALGYRFVSNDRPAREGSAEQRREGEVVRLAKGSLLWNNTLGYVRQQVKVLHDAILSTTANRPDFKQISACAERLDEIFDVLDVRLTKKMNELRAAHDPTEKQNLIGEARGIVSDYQKYLAEDWLMRNIDINGFVPLDINVKVSSALKAVLGVL